MPKHALEQIEQEHSAIGNTPKRNVRVEDSSWEHFLAVTAVHRTNASAGVRRFIDACNDGHAGALAILEGAAEDE